jgi:hypothetical protein
MFDFVGSERCACGSHLKVLSLKRLKLILPAKNYKHEIIVEQRLNA